jgi:hypothetical protein
MSGLRALHHYTVPNRPSSSSSSSVRVRGSGQKDRGGRQAAGVSLVPAGKPAEGLRRRGGWDGWGNRPGQSIVCFCNRRTNESDNTGRVALGFDPL